MSEDHAPQPNRYTAFFQKVDTRGFDQSQCWPWLGAGNGYGNARLNGTYMTAHRAAYELFCGPVPGGMDVCHACDNRWCVNPDHLFLGTRAANMNDCKSKGRTAGGNRKRLTEAQVQEIQRRLNAGEAPSRIGRHMDVNRETIANIGKGKSYGRR
jgi:hypothetical protein